MKKLEILLAVKPLSANVMYLRNRHKTAAYKNYQMEIRDELMGIDWPFGNTPVKFDIDAGFSTRAADIDNVLKPLLDTFQSIYDDFNDNKVYELQATKYIVPKGREFLRVRITETAEPETPKQVQQETKSET